jgi:hypothetical protein
LLLVNKSRVNFTNARPLDYFPRVVRPNTSAGDDANPAARALHQLRNLARPSERCRCAA